MPDADGSYFENQHKGYADQMRISPHEPIVVSMQMAREASWKKKVVMWTGSRRNCNCGYDNPGFPWKNVPDICKVRYSLRLLLLQITASVLFPPGYSRTEDSLCINQHSPYSFSLLRSFLLVPHHHLISFEKIF